MDHDALLRRKAGTVDLELATLAQIAEALDVRLTDLVEDSTQT